ncbi:MAG TPA: hypothetical protein ENH29_00520 [Bacteroidetes bacterium]|nr:hypothetical protein [Bacteroidota bacterium]
MSNQFDEFIRVIKVLEEKNVEYVLIGGVAMVLHGLERLTRDIDIFINPSKKNISNLQKALNSIFHDKSIEEITLDEFANYSVIRYGTPNGFNIDLVSQLGEAVTFNDLAWESIDYREIIIKIATPETLYNLKKNTLRDKDKMDILFLKEIIRNR